MTPEQLAELTFWVERYAAGVDRIDAQTVAAILALYQGQNFYSRTVAAEIAEQAAETTNVAAVITAGLAAQYLAVTTSLIGDEQLPTPAILLEPLRNGADMRRVYQRPLKLFRRQVAAGVDPAVAFQQAMTLAETLTTTNNNLAARDAWRQTLRALADDARITGYRRIVHPELSRTGTCGLCIVASDNVYNSGDLLPIHGRCKCTVLPIIGERGGDGDPGNSLNNLSLGGLYTAAGSTFGDDLKKVRVSVNEHGEYGPTLTDARQKFTSWEDLGLVAPNAA